MSRISADDQIKFLLCCVRHANNGKIDFAEVARECAIVSRSAACKRYDRLLKANGLTRKGTSNTETKPKKRDANGIAKAAEEKRRKIERNQNDPAADDDDIKPVVPKLEPGTAPNIKPEPGSGYHSFPYSSTFTQAHYTHVPSYLPTWTTSPVPSYLPNHATTTAQHPMWQNSGQIFPRTTPSPSTIRRDVYNENSTEPSPAIPAGCMKTETTTEQPALPSAPQYPQTEQVRQQNSASLPPQDATFEDFCRADLFMPPLQRKHTPPLPPPTQPRMDNGSRETERVERNAFSTNTPANNPTQLYAKPNQPECIIIDD